MNNTFTSMSFVHLNCIARDSSSASPTTSTTGGGASARRKKAVTSMSLSDLCIRRNHLWWFKLFRLIHIFRCHQHFSLEIVIVSGKIEEHYEL